MRVILRYVKTHPSQLSPFLRSDAQGAVLAETLTDPARELSISEVARRTGLLPAVAHREVTRLLDADVLRDRREGKNRLVRANTDHPLWEPMSQIVQETYGPVPVLRGLLQQLSGVDGAYIYGSWAARRAGVSGPPPRDVDVLVVGTPTRSALLDLVHEAEARLRIEVNVHRVTSEAWEDRADPFLATVAARPLFSLIEGEDHHG